MGSQCRAACVACLRSQHRLFVLLLVYVILSGTLACAIDFHLLSSDRTISTADSDSVTAKMVVASNGGAVNCALVELDAGTDRGAITFTYDSNISITDVRSQLLVSTHMPSSATDGLAVLDSIDGIVEVTTFTPYELRKFNDAADKKESEFLDMERTRAGSANAADTIAAGKQLTFDRDAARAITVHFRAASFPANSGGMRVKSGSHAICFTLDPRRLVRRTGDNRLVERVTIGLLELSTTYQVQHRAGANRRRKTAGNPALSRAGGLAGEAWSSPQELLRRELAAMEEAKANGQDDADDILTTDDISQKLDALTACRDEMLLIVRETQHLFSRFMRMRETAEATFTRVWVSTVFLVLVCITVVWFTFRQTRAVIVKRKLI